MSRMLIFYVSMKLAQFCDRQRMLKAEEEPPQNTSGEEVGQPGTQNATAPAIQNERPHSDHLSINLDE